MMTNRESVDDLMEVVGDLKDRVYDLELLAQHKANPPRLAPETRADQPWSPCTREETTFYAALTEFV